MIFGNTLRALTISAGVLLASVGLANAASVSFDVTFRTYVDCVRPTEMNKVPLVMKGRMTLNGDGTAVGRMNMTAYRFVTFPMNASGKLGAPPMPLDGVPGATVQLKVLNKNGLSLLASFPNNTFGVNVDVSEDGSKCVAGLTNTLKRGQTEYNIYAGDTYYYCTGFRITSSSCSAR
jgi:hypothetical protein